MPSTAAAPDQVTHLTWQMQFTSHIQSVSLVRKQVRRTLDTWNIPEDDTTTAILISSELATNAVRHGHIHGHLFEVGLALTPGDLLIEVSDANRTPPNWATPLTDDHEHGRGLHLVADLTNGRLSHQERHPVGKTVRAYVHLTTGREK